MVFLTGSVVVVVDVVVVGVSLSCVDVCLGDFGGVAVEVEAINFALDTLFSAFKIKSLDGGDGCCLTSSVVEAVIAPLALPTPPPPRAGNSSVSNLNSIFFTLIFSLSELFLLLPLPLFDW